MFFLNNLISGVYTQVRVREVCKSRNTECRNTEYILGLFSYILVYYRIGKYIVSFIKILLCFKIGKHKYDS